MNDETQRVIERAESQVLTAAIVGVPIGIATHITSEHFVNPRAGEIWQACLDIEGERRPRTFLTVQDRLRKVGSSVTFDDLERYNSRDMDETDVRLGVEVLVEHWQRRRIRAFAATVADAAKDPSQPITNVMADAWSNLRDIDLGRESTTVPVHKAIAAMIEQAHAASRRESPAAPTGFPRLDRVCNGGFYPGQQIVIGGRPKNGKSALALQILINAAKRNVPCIFFGLEMQTVEQARRICANQAGVQTSAFYGQGDADDYAAMMRVHNATQPWRLGFNDRSHTIEKIIVEARDWRRQHRTAGGIVAVDYLQLMHTSTRTHSREQEIASMSRRLKLLAQEIECTTLVVSQLNRAVDTRTDKTPTMSDLRESGAIEQDADVVLLVWRPFMHDPDNHPASKAFVRVAANRSGQGGIDVEMRFGCERMTFHEVDTTR